MTLFIRSLYFSNNKWVMLYSWVCASCLDRQFLIYEQTTKIQLQYNHDHDGPNYFLFYDFHWTLTITLSNTFDLLNMLQLPFLLIHLSKIVAMKAVDHELLNLPEHLNLLPVLDEESEDTKGVIRIRKSKKDEVCVADL